MPVPPHLRGKCTAGKSADTGWAGPDTGWAGPDTGWLARSAALKYPAICGKGRSGRFTDYWYFAPPCAWGRYGGDDRVRRADW